MTIAIPSVIVSFISIKGSYGQQAKRLGRVLHNDSIPMWLQSQIEGQRDEILAALQAGHDFTIFGPNGEEIRISPDPVAA